MTRRELVDQLARMPEFDEIPFEELNRLVKLFFGSLTSALASGRKIEIRGFGSFSNRLRKAYIARNPKAKKQVEAPDRMRVHFKPGKALRERVNQNPQFETDPIGT